MWFMGKIRESVENFPFEVGRTLGMKEELSAKAHLSSKLHSNILTPDKIPDFCIPPRLSPGPPSRVESTSAKSRLQSITSGIQAGTPRPINTAPPPRHIIQIENVDRIGKANGKGKAGIGVGSPHSLAHSRAWSLHHMAGLYESPNTRRKESLFLSEFTGHSLERTAYRPPGRPLAVSPCKALSEQGSTESDTLSSNDSSPHGSPVLTRSLSSSALLKLFGQDSPVGHLSRSSSKQSLGGDSCGSLEEHGLSGSSMSPGEVAPVPLCGSLAPPVLFPLDLLHCQERLQREHVLPLQGRGRVRLSAERDRTGTTMRIRVVSVEDLHDGAPEGRLVHCCVCLYLTPGKRQRQNSATIRNCRNPIFNEDFFFTDLSDECLRSLALRLKVLDKASSLKRDAVLGTTSKPLSQLLPL
ncbi:C2 calcium-dependent domain-containing protein 4C [Megalops cyprinoides]|uniref:C2 calcium-dependent domain-containing protein 4C n=1 Tax=Megalops cyprinoides TaxID=118141 RepID=UPI0018655E8B|nr:C2 calcium-dependent domain-containing protein 4C [Megalops cyprinoides]